MALVGSVPTLEAQVARAPLIPFVWDYLRACMDPATAEYRRLRSVEVGVETRVDLAEGAFALEQAYLTKDPADAKFESHLAHIDIQLVVAGAELMQVTDVRHLTVRENFTPARDVIFYAPSEAVSSLYVGPGEAAVFFPADAHRPCLRTGSSQRVQKTVVKIPIGLLGA